ncbi:hypothetical protein Ddc_19386 [Ditylenchus destructor]|nr:hypothetical protein Ddc_19386 [Ditylenchus destructor]
MLQPRLPHMGGRAHDRALHQTDRAGRAQHAEPRQHHAHHDVEALAVLAQPRVGGDQDLGRGDRRRRVAAQAQAVEAAGLAQAVGLGVDQPQRARALGRERAAGPDVAVRLEGAGDPALARVQHHLRAAAAGSADRCPEVAARAGLGEGQRAQVFAGGDVAPHGLGAERLDHGGRRVMHAHDHRGGRAVAGDAADHLGGLAQTGALAADRGRGDQPQQPRAAQRIDGLAGEAALAIGADGQRFR